MFTDLIDGYKYVTEFRGDSYISVLFTLNSVNLRKQAEVHNRL
jgi:hypothetical protein